MSKSLENQNNSEVSSLNNEQEYESNYIFEIKTVQSSPFRSLIEALKEILTDANIEFDENGMKIVAMDASHTVLVHLKLDAKKFDYYHCKGKQVLGISMVNLYKYIKMVGNNSTLTLFLENDNQNQLGLKFEEGEKNSIDIWYVNLMDLAEEQIQIPPASFESVITMPSNDFQKLARDFYNVTEYIELKSVGKQIIFSCKGCGGKGEHKIGENTNGISFVKNNDEIVQGIFSLKYLVMFTKCTNLSNQIQIFLKNDYPLIICYSVASLGDIKLCLAPQQGSTLN